MDITGWMGRQLENQYFLELGGEDFEPSIPYATTRPPDTVP